MLPKAAVPYSPDLEEPEPDEQSTIVGLNEALETILSTTARDYGHAVRSVHASRMASLRA